MFFPKPEVVARIRENYPAGTRVELIKMKDRYRKMEPGLRGTVRIVDDTGTIHVDWDNGSSLGIVFGEDMCRKI